MLTLKTKHHSKQVCIQLCYYICFWINTHGKVWNPFPVPEYTNYISADGQDPLLSNECPGYDTKQSDGEAPMILKLWRMQNTPSLPLLPEFDI